MRRWPRRSAGRGRRIAHPCAAPRPSPAASASRRWGRERFADALSRLGVPYVCLVGRLAIAGAAAFRIAHARVSYIDAGGHHSPPSRWALSLLVIVGSSCGWRLPGEAVSEEATTDIVAGAPGARSLGATGPAF